MATPFEGWAVLELMGHRLRPGFVQEVEVAGTKMLRVDIPVGNDEAGQDVIVTEYYGGQSVYALRPCTEEVARHQTKWMSDPRPTRPLDFRPRAEVEQSRAQLAFDDDDDPCPI